MRYFSPDHCPRQSWCTGILRPWRKRAHHHSGPVQHLGAKSSLERGQEFQALVDTRAPPIQHQPRHREGRNPPGPPIARHAEGRQRQWRSPSFASFTHVFHTLSFNGIDVNNPKVLIMPDRMNSASREQQTGNQRASWRFQSEIAGFGPGHGCSAASSRLHMAFKERRFYITLGSEPRKAGDELTMLDKAVEASPTNAGILNTRCFTRGLQRIVSGRRAR